MDRTALLDNNALNEWLLARLGDLVAAAAEDTFGVARRKAGGGSHLSLKGGDPAHGSTQRFVTYARRSASASRVESRSLRRAGSPIKLPEALVEAPSLTDLFAADELERLDIERLPTWGVTNRPSTSSR